MDDRLRPCNPVFGKVTEHSEAEFEEFLTSIGWGSAYRPSLAAVDQSPQSLPIVDPPIFVPKAPQTARGTSSRPAIGPVLRYVFATFLVLCVALRHPLSVIVESSWARFSGQTTEEAQARAMFARARLMALSPGTTVEEVRERVGLPASRGAGNALLAEEAWYYGVPPTEPHGSPTFYTVAVSEGKVVRVVDITPFRTSTGAAKVAQDTPRYYGDLKLQVKNRYVSLHATSNTAVLLTGGASEAPELPKAHIRVVHAERAKVVRTGREIDLQSLWLYWRGMLYPLPVCTSDLPNSVLADDLKWLCRSLGCDETGREMPLLPAKGPR